MRLLVGDIGGTRTRLQVVESSGDGPQVIRQQQYPSASYERFEAIVDEFLGLTEEKTGPSPGAACFAVAGPVIRQQARVTNLPWYLDAAGLARTLGLQQVRLINDFHAIALGIDGLDKADLVDLQSGQADPQGTRVVLGAGTGLGQGIMTRDEAGRTCVVDSEGGHADFAPVTKVQWELSEYLRRQFGRVTVEHLVSGPGLVRIHEFLSTRASGLVTPALRRAMQNGDPAEAVSRFALTDKDATAVEALDLFIGLYGACAGNLALTAMATGGVYLAGGIAPRLVSRLGQGDFIEAFCNRPPMTELLRNMPVQVVMNEQVGLLGATRAALALAGIDTTT